MKKIIYLLSIILLLTINFYAQKNDAILVGHALFKGEHLPGVNIILKGTTIGCATDITGHYYLRNLPEGKFTLRVSSIGFKTIEQEVTLVKGQTTQADFDLEEDMIMTDNVVVSGNRLEVNKKDAPVVVGLISPKLYEQTNSLNLAEGLNFQSGLRVENNCQNCGFQQVRINGLEGPYTQILIDSRPIFSALSGVYGIEQIPANMIDRVEVVKGGGSALYGANAIGGTVNIITKEPVNNNYQVLSDYSLIDGKVPETNLFANTTLITDNYNAGIVLFGSYRNRKQFDADGDGFSELSKIDGHSLGFKSYYKPGINSKIELEYHNLKEFRRGGNKFDLQPHETDITEQTDHIINGGGLSYKYLTNSFNLNLYSSIQYVKRDSYYGAEEDPNAYGNTTDLSYVIGTQSSYELSNLIFAPSNIMAGVEYNYNSLHDVMAGYNRDLKQDVKVFGLFLQNEWKSDKFNFLVGTRFDKHNLIKNLIVSPRFTFLYKPSDVVQTRLAYSKGFRAPQAFDEDLHIMAVNGEVQLIRLADNLDTEKSNSYTASIDLYPKIGDIGLNFLVESFYTKLYNVFYLQAVGEDALGNQILERRNGSGAEVYGLSLEGKLAFNANINMQFGFTFQNSKYLEAQTWSEDEEVAPSREMPRTPNQYGYLTFNYTPFNRFNINLSGKYTGSMYIQHFAGYIEKDILKKTDTFFELNTKFSYAIPFTNENAVELSVGAQNLFNSYQKDFDKGVNRDAGYLYGPTRPRTIYFGIKISSL